MSYSLKHVLPCYLFPPIGWWKLFIENPCEIEIHESWIKQTYRNRFEICGPNGRMNLIVPTVKKSRTSFAETLIDSRENWISHHFRSLEAGYNRSPYFEFYKDELEALLKGSTGRLLELNENALKWCMTKLEIDRELEFTKDFVKEHPSDHRLEALNSPQGEYLQVFQEKLGFTGGLSVLDLLFNLGPASGSFLYSASSSE